MYARLFALIGICATLLPFGTIRAQDTRRTVAQGNVVDTLKAPLAEARVLVIDSTHAVVSVVRSDSNGVFTVPGLAPHTAYTFSVQKVGFVGGTAKFVTPGAGDTLWFDVMLQQATPQMTPVTVTANANPAYHIDSVEITKHPVQNALDVVMRYRPRMMGDAYQECRPDTSHLGPPIPPRMQPPSIPMMGAGGRKITFDTNPPASVAGRTFFDTSLAAHGYPPPPRLSNLADTLGKRPPYLYVNGVLHSELGMKNILADIPAEDIAEMHYIDCWDKSFPERMRNALFIILKPGKAY